ncbi:hypothetical protein LEP1GSC124_3333 [Leptospira interrogans serovar Pyrogenes str. 200701872]|uniref:Uncharacterized protein n=1 Tax=Leptospira interrogans serovar Pyrogenes str. 200701872 TaxID=1193029 RepID=M6ZKA2_LEPIR|nr:hypothetical protein LEP1GSC124_3333 [Leptospira interrogans serovar Pyrogenes str. 200701872]
MIEVLQPQKEQRVSQNGMCKYKESDVFSKRRRFLTFSNHSSVVGFSDQYGTVG